MLTYEVRFVCDGCGERSVSGDPMRELALAIISTALQAKLEGWISGTGEKWFCRYCERPAQEPDSVKPPAIWLGHDALAAFLVHGELALIVESVLLNPVMAELHVEISALGL